MSGARDTREYVAFLTEAAEKVKTVLGEGQIALVLGSGVNDFVREMKGAKELSYADIPHMPLPTVQGHVGKLVHGSIGGCNVFCFAGRIHQYEGHEGYLLTFAARLMAFCGVRVWLATNAAGGAIPGQTPPYFILISDLLNHTCKNPLEDTAQSALVCNRNAGMSGILSPRVRDIAHRVADAEGIGVFDGVYAWNMGPTYESHAETRGMFNLGVRSFGMSTVPELHAAAALGMEVAGISVVTNLSSCLSKSPLTHEEVNEIATEAAPMFKKLLFGIVPLLAEGLRAVDVPLPDAAAEAFPLPMPTFVAPSTVATSEAVSFVKSKGDVSATTAIFMPECVNLDEFLLSMKGRVDVKISEIPHCPVYSYSGRRAELTFGTVDEEHVCLGHGIGIEGFSLYESEFLVLLLDTLGCRKLVQGLCGVATSPGASFPRIAGIHDVLNVMGPHRSLPGSFESTNPLSVVSATDPSVAYAAVCGPTFPSKFEVEKLDTVGANVVGVSSLGILNTARDRNWTVSGLAFVSSPMTDMRPLIDMGREMKRILGTVDVLPVLASALAAAKVETVSEDHVPLTFDIDVPRPRPPRQFCVDDVKNGSGLIRKQCGEKVDSILVVLGGLDQLWFPAFVGKTAVVKGSELPGLPHLSNSRAEIVVGEVGRGSRRICAVRHDCPVYSGVDLYLLTSLVRMVVSSFPNAPVRLVTLARAAVESFSVGDVAIVSDMINLTGNNALCGANLLGLRFPDVSQFFKKQEGFRDVTAAMTVGGFCPSAAEEKRLRAWGADVLIKDALPEVTAVNQAGSSAILFVVITGTCAKGRLPIPQSALDRLNSLLEH